MAVGEGDVVGGTATATSATWNTTELQLDVRRNDRYVSAEFTGFASFAEIAGLSLITSDVSAATK